MENIGRMAVRPRWWDGAGELAVLCNMCSRKCLIKEGDYGRCGARRNLCGRMESPFLGRFASIAVDPIEKKPLRHWRPGTKIFSLGSIGCNFFCPFCQNHSLSRARSDRTLEEVSPESLLEMVLRLGLSSVAYTYNEPTLQAEYILAVAPLLADNGIASVMVTNGSFSKEVRNELSSWVQAMNIDVKTFNHELYEKLGGSLDAVKANVEELAQSGVHIELTSLIVPGISDSERDFSRLVDWAADISSDIPLHISRYFPAFKYSEPPTSIHLMKKFFAIAEKKLRHVHLGNV